MKKFLIILLLMLTIILPTFATNWVQVGEKAWLDVDTIEPFMDDFGHLIPNQYSFWVKYLNDGDMKETEKYYNKKIWYMLSKNIIDINRKTLASKSLVIYDLKDKPIDSHENRSTLMEWKSIIPNTVGDLEYEIIRRYVRPRK